MLAKFNDYDQIKVCSCLVCKLQQVLGHNLAENIFLDQKGIFIEILVGEIPIIALEKRHFPSVTHYLYLLHLTTQ